MLWKAVRDTHWDPNLGGLDWEAVHDELAPQVEQAGTMTAARILMMDAIRRLNQSHFALIPREVYADIRSPQAGQGEGEIGLTVRVADGQALVAAVRAGSPAEEHGVRPGWVITRIADEEVAPLIARITAAYEDSTLHQLVLVSALRARLTGPVGEQVQVEFLDQQDRRVVVAIPRAPPVGKRVVLGHLPPMYLYFETRRLEGDAGYIAFSVFLDPETLMRQFEGALRSCMDARGLILDLRGNPGGIGAMAMGIAGWFVDRADRRLGTMRTRQAELNFVISPRAETFDGPLAVLIDGCTGSTAEILAGGLQDLGRARVFGTRSAGAALPAVLEKLPNGDGFLHAIADYVSAGGRRLEAAGVTPDVEVPLTRAALLAGRDPALEAAVEWIRSPDPHERSGDITSRFPFNPQREHQPSSQEIAE